MPGIRGLHCKIAASSVLYANEKNIYDPDYISGLSRALLGFFPTTFLEIAIYDAKLILDEKWCSVITR